MKSIKCKCGLEIDPKLIFAAMGAASKDKKKNITTAERQRRSENMHRLWASGKMKRGKKSNSTQ